MKLSEPRDVKVLKPQSDPQADMGSSIASLDSSSFSLHPSMASSCADPASLDSNNFSLHPSMASSCEDPAEEQKNAPPAVDNVESEDPLKQLDLHSL